MATHFWLLRTPEIFASDRPEILARLGLKLVRVLGRDYLLVQPPAGPIPADHPALRWVPWRLPLQHVWPCRPEAIPGFLEKAAQTLVTKFAHAGAEAFFCGPLEHHQRQRNLRLLASNLRGRTLQLAPPEWKSHPDPESLPPQTPTLYAMIGREGLFAGVTHPAAAGGFFPGGMRFFRTTGEDAISRAGAKVAGALHLLKLNRPAPAAPAHWLELGASPGGMTSELLSRGYEVTAIDRAPLDPRVAAHPKLHFVLADAAFLAPPRQPTYHALLCDLNGLPHLALETLLRFLPSLHADAPVLFTFKTTGLSTPAEIDAMEARLLAQAAQAGLHLTLRTHLAANRHEFTLIFQRA